MAKDIALRLVLDDDGRVQLKKFKKEYDDTLKEMRDSTAKTSTQMSASFSRIESRMNRLASNRIFRSFRVGFTGMVKTVKGSMTAIIRHLKLGMATLTSFAKTAGGLGALIGTAGLGILTKSIVAARAELERYQVQFRVLYGNAKDAASALNLITEFARTTPFELPEVIRAARQLKVLTEGELATAEGLELVGDAAAAAGVRIDEISMWFGRLYDGLQSGRPVGEAMMRLQELGIVSGKTRSMIENMQKAGVDGAKVWEAFAQSAAKFKGMMIEQSKTLEGIMSNISDTFWKVRTMIAERFYPDIKAAAQGFLDSLDRMMESGAIDRMAEKIGTAVKVILKTFGALFGYIRSRMDTIKELGKIIGILVGVKVAILALTSPVMAVVGVVVGAIEIWHRWGDEIKGFADKAVKAVSGWLSSFYRQHQGVLNTVIGLFKKFINFVVGVGRFYISIWTDIFTAVGKIAGKWFSWIWGKLKWLVERWIDIKRTMLKIWVNLGAGIVKVFKGVLTWIWDKLKWIAQKIADIFSLVGKQIRIGMEEMSTGVPVIAAGTAGVVDVYVDALEEAAGRVGEATSSLFEAGADFVGKYANRFKRFVSEDYVGAAVESIGKGVEALKNKTGDAISAITDYYSSAETVAEESGKKMESAAAAAGNGIKAGFAPVSKEVVSFFDKYKDAGLSAVDVLEREFEKDAEFFFNHFEELTKMGLDYERFYLDFEKRISEAIEAENEERLKNNFQYWMNIVRNTENGSDKIMQAWQNLIRIVERGGVSVSAGFGLGIDDALMKMGNLQTMAFDFGSDLAQNFRDGFSNIFEQLMIGSEDFFSRFTESFQSMISNLADITRRFLGDVLAKTLMNKMRGAFDFESKGQTQSTEVDVLASEKSLTIFGKKLEGTVKNSVVAGMTAALNLVAASQRPGGVRGGDIGSAFGMIAGALISGGNPLVGMAIGGAVGGIFGNLFDNRSNEENRMNLKAVADNTREMANQLEVVNRNLIGLRQDNRELYPMLRSYYFRERGNDSIEQELALSRAKVAREN